MRRHLVVSVPLLVLLALAYAFWPIPSPQNLDEVPHYLSRRYGDWAKALARRARAGELSSQDQDTIAFTYFTLHPEQRLEICEFKDQVPSSALYSKRIELSEQGLREFRRQTGLNVPDHFHVYMQTGESDRLCSQLLAELLLNDNSLHFLNTRRELDLESFPGLLGLYAEWFREQRFDPAEFCLDNGVVMALYGIRDTHDIDFLHLGHRKKIRYTRPELCQSHNQVLKSVKAFPISIEEIIQNPARHFYYYGQKVASFDTMRTLKQLRRREKDLRDLRHMAALEAGELAAAEPERRPRSLHAVPAMLKQRYPTWGKALWRRAQEGRLSEEDRDVVALMYCMLNFRSRVVIQDREPADALYGKPFELNERAQRELQRQTGIQIPARGSLWVLRRGYGYDRDRSLHLAQALLNRNSLHWLQHRSDSQAPNFTELVRRLDKWVASAGYSKEEICIDSGAVLAAYGLRDCSDLDFLHLDPRLQLDRRRPKGCNSHNAELAKLGMQESVADVVTDPSQHFYAYGYKFSSPQLLKVFKAKRGSGKDQRDLALLAALPDKPVDSLAPLHSGT